MVLYHTPATKKNTRLGFFQAPYAPLKTMRSDSSKLPLSAPSSMWPEDLQRKDSNENFRPPGFHLVHQMGMSIFSHQ